MSENNETKKITIPLQSDDGEFDNFFGLKFEMDMTDALFKCLCYSMDFSGCFAKKRNITVLFENSKDVDIYFCDCKVLSLSLSFKFYKNRYYLVGETIKIQKPKELSNCRLLTEAENLVKKYSLQVKKNYLFHKPTKREILVLEDDETASICISEKGSGEYYDYYLNFLNFLIGRFFYYQTSSRELITNKFNNEELRNLGTELLIIILKIKRKIEDLSAFSNFFVTKNHIKYLPDLAKEIKNILKSAPDYNDEKAICTEINAFMEKRINEISAEEKQKKAAKKAEKEKANEENMSIKKALYASLAAM